MLQHGVPQSCDVCIGFRLQDRIIGLCVAVVEEREGIERLGACVCCGRAAFGMNRSCITAERRGARDPTTKSDNF